MNRLPGLNGVMHSRTDESLRTVVVALATNLGTAVAKLIAALITGSSAMWAQTFHAFADSGNEVLLLIAQRRSGHPPDEQHPLGYGRAAYFWALVASMGVFAIGALLSVQQGIEGLVHRVPIASFRVAYLILFISFCLDGASLIQAERQLRKEALLLKRTFLEQLDLSSDPVVRAVFAEDAAALVGARCSIVEPEQEDLPSGTIFRRILRVESLRHDKGCICEANFDYDFGQLRVSPRLRSGMRHAEIDPCNFPLNDVRLKTIVRNFVRAMALVNDADVGEEVRFGEQMASIQLS
jgi:hypothetical protein